MRLRLLLAPLAAGILLFGWHAGWRLHLATLAGTTRGYRDGPGPSARFDQPGGLAIAPDGAVIVADTYNHRIRRVACDGVVTTLAGGGDTGVHSGGMRDGDAEQARFRFPRDVAVDGAGNVYVADTNNQAIRRIAPDGRVTTLAGGTRGYRDGAGDQARFDDPWNLTVTRGGVVYVADTYNQRIRRISPDGRVSTLAGGGPTGIQAGGYRDGLGAQARFHAPRGLVMDGEDVLVADAGNRCIRRITPAGLVTTVAGMPTRIDAQGNAIGGALIYPTAIALGPDGIYVSDSAAHQIWRVARNAVRGLLLGDFGDRDGWLFLSGLNDAQGLARGENGALYVADTTGNRIRRL
ncbi:MAG TPA: hypothetical protein V6D47_08905 [Oscillatoriaceae cyanobacterium]